MSRIEVRNLKRALIRGSSASACEVDSLRARESALQLLARSIRFGHRRLAVKRLVQAVRAGADVTSEQWAYCEEAVDSSVDAALWKMLVTAKSHHSAAVPSNPP